MIKWLQKKLYKRRAQKVGDYYNEWSRRFMQITDTFQGFRTEDIKVTHQHTIDSAGLRSGMNILDAGCGVGGPAFYFAEVLEGNVYALTNSEAQVEILEERKKKEVRKNLFPVFGDYHQLGDNFSSSFFDTVLFLESLGHSYYPEKVILESFNVLKPTGVLYIRDHYILEGTNTEETKKIKSLTKYADDLYVYNHTDIGRIEAAILKPGFKLEFIRKPQLKFFNINPEFEKRFGIKSPDGYFIDTLEIRAVKP